MIYAGMGENKILDERTLILCLQNAITYAGMGENKILDERTLILCLQNTIIYAGRGEQKTVNHRTNLWLTETNGLQPGVWDHSVSQKQKSLKCLAPLAAIVRHHTLLS